MWVKCPCDSRQQQKRRNQAHIPIHRSYEVFIKLLRSCAADWDDVNGKLKWQGNRSTKQTSSLYRFYTFIDNCGILHVNGRIKRANISNDLTQLPLASPSRSLLTNFIGSEPWQSVHDLRIVFKVVLVKCLCRSKQEHYRRNQALLPIHRSHEMFLSLFLLPFWQIYWQW